MSSSTHQLQAPKGSVDQAISLYKQGEMEHTISLSETLVEHFPDTLILYDILGAAYMAIGNAEKTIKSYQKALKLDPNHTDAYNNMGTVFYEIGNLDEALECYKKAVKLEPYFAGAHYNLGNILQHTGNLKKAIESYKTSLAIQPNDVDVLLSFGSVLKDYGEFEQAIECYARALKINPDLDNARINMENTAKEKAEIDNLVIDYAKVVKNKVDSAELISFMGTILQLRGYLDLAIEKYEKAIKISPNYDLAHYSMGTALVRIGEFDRAIKALDKALKIKPDYFDAMFHKSRLLLNRHDFKLGWTMYGVSRNLKFASTELPIKRAKRWKGSSLLGKNIELYASQGLGDEILYSSCIPDLIQETPNNIYLECDPRLKPLFARSFPSIIIYGVARKDIASLKRYEIIRSQENIHIDYSNPIDSLPEFFRNHIADFPKRNSYLVPDPKLVKKWTKRLSRFGEGLKIGISWKTGAGRGENLSIPLKFWREVLSLEAFFVNLQYGDVSGEIEQFQNENKIEIYDWKDNDPLLDLDNQAALISQLDLVISVDNATVHSCVALGTEVWDLMDPGLNLMWMDNGTNSSPLSPNLRLFRRKPQSRWTTVLKEVEIALRVRTQSTG